MSNAKPDSNAPEDDPLLSQPSYIYHHQKPPPRSRYVRPTRTPPKEKKGSGEVIRETIYAHMITFGIVIGSMLVLMVLAVVVSNKIWALRQEQLSRGTPRPAPADLRRLPRSGEGRGSTDLSLARLNTNEAVLSPETVSNYEKAFWMGRCFDNPWMIMGQVYLRQQEYRKAQVALELSIGTNWYSAQLFNDLGVTHLQQRDYRTAQNLFKAALRDDREYTPAYFNMALSQIAQGNTESAKGYLNAYLSRRPDDPKALRERAILDAGEQRYADALKTLQRALESDQESPLLYFDAASVAALMNELELSADYLEHAIPLTSVMTVYRYYQLPQFKNLRTSDPGKDLEKRMADKVRSSMTASETSDRALPASHPMTSMSSP